MPEPRRKSRARTRWKGNNFKINLSTKMGQPLSISITILLIASPIYASLASLLGARENNGCMLQQCAQEFDRVIQRDKIIPTATPRYCQLMKTYAKCLASTSGPCRGDLRFHGIESVLKRELYSLDCDNVLARFENGTDSVDYGSCLDILPQGSLGGGRQRVCQLFGDTHLRTFDGQYSTCTVKGAWPLVENDYFAVQITSSVPDDAPSQSLAASVSQVTVIVKSLSGCTGEKLYTTFGNDSAVSRTFVDGTIGTKPSAGGFPGARRRGVSIGMGHQRRHYYRPVEIVPYSTSYVEIKLRYISTRIVIRRHGRHLSTLVRMPEPIVLSSLSKPSPSGEPGPGAADARVYMDSPQLCTGGCPPNGKMHVNEALVRWEELKQCGIGGMSREQAFRICVEEHSVTDSYLDACVYDLILTGDTALAAAAAAALADIRSNHPPYRKHIETNRTQLVLFQSAAGTSVGTERPDNGFLAECGLGVAEVRSAGVRSSLVGVLTIICSVLVRMIVIGV